MTFNNYQLYAKDSVQWPARVAPEIYCTLGIAGEAGEVVEKVKKVVRNQGLCFSKVDLDAIALEIGDLLWYMSQLCDLLGMEFDDVAARNLQKLSSRRKRGTLYGEGDDR